MLCGRGLTVFQVADWADHKDECTNLKRVSPRRPREPARLMARIVLRWKRELEDPTAETLLGTRRRLKDCMDHKDKIMMDRDRAKGFIEMLGLLKQFLSGPQLERIADTDILRLFGVMCVNTIHVADDDGNLGCALYLAASMIDHSCRPNLNGSFRGRKLVLMPLREVEVNSVSDLSLAYIPLHTTKARRREELNKCYYFTCECEMCSGSVPEVMTESDPKLTEKVFALRDLTLSMSNAENPKQALDAIEELLAGPLADLEGSDVAKFTALLTAADASVSIADYARARDYYLRSLPTLKRVYTEYHGQYAYKMVRLCRLLIITTKQAREVDEVSRLVMFLRETLRITKLALGEDHFDTKDVALLYEEMMATMGRCKTEDKLATGDAPEQRDGADAEGASSSTKPEVAPEVVADDVPGGDKTTDKSDPSELA